MKKIILMLLLCLFLVGCFGKIDFNYKNYIVQKNVFKEYTHYYVKSYKNDTWMSNNEFYASEHFANIGDCVTMDENNNIIVIKGE